MAGRIARAFIDELIARADLVELIGARVPLKKSGREHKACCPFHDEKTPSFWVNPDKQFYYCFGCHAHGTALDFLMQYDRLSFPEAVEDLAGRLGLAVVYDAASGAAPRASGEDGGERAAAQAAQAMFAVLEEACGQFRANLAANARARAYATERGLTPEIIERFAIGYAADSWNDLLRRAGGAGRLGALASAGLIIEREASVQSEPAAARYYDRFRDRLMFPIRDTRGRVMAFGGRVLGSGEPKYLNSPETPLFHKGRELYGLYETRLARVTPRRLLVVEGYMDVVQLHQHGLTEAVATLGTATTIEHVRRAFRLVSEIVFAFDGDRAGRGAAWRALQNVLPEARAGREIRFLFLPEGEDPDSLVRREGGEQFRARLAAATPLSEYLVDHLSESCDLHHADGKARFIEAARPLVEKLTPGVYRELLIERIAQALELPATRLQHWLGGAAVPVGALTPPASGPTAAHSAAREPRPRPSSRSAAAGAGRGGLVTQAVALALHFPAAAAAVEPSQRSALAGLELPGAEVLARLLEEQAGTPAPTMAQTLERWRDRHEYRRLCDLAAKAPLVPDADAARRELADAVRRLLERELRSRRLGALIEKARGGILDSQEKLELQALTMDQRASSDSRAAVHARETPGPEGSSRRRPGR